MSDHLSRLQNYYGADPGRELGRLLDPRLGAVEFELTTRAIARHLPANSRVLDLGGGPGRYTVHLARLGHRVTLADLVPELLEVARSEIEAAGVRANVDEVVAVDACNLERWSGAVFDGVLCLGPFYHLTDPERRARAAREIARVIRPGGVLFAAFMPRLLFLLRAISVPEERHHLRDAEFVRRVLEEGVFENDAPGRFDVGYGARPEEVIPFFETHGFEPLTLMATEGVAPLVYRELGEMAETDPESYAAALDIFEMTAADPSVLGTAGHLLYVGRRRGPRLP